MENEYLQLLVRLSIWIGSMLTLSIGALVLYIRHQHKVQIRDHKDYADKMEEYLQRMLLSEAANTGAMERNNDLIEKLLIKRR